MTSVNKPLQKWYKKRASEIDGKFSVKNTYLEASLVTQW